MILIPIGESCVSRIRDQKSNPQIDPAVRTRLKNHIYITRKEPDYQSSDGPKTWRWVVKSFPVVYIKISHISSVTCNGAECEHF